MQDKFDRLANSFAEEEFTVTDILRILCAFTARMMRECGSETAFITEVIHGEGIKFTINVKAEAE